MADTPAPQPGSARLDQLPPHNPDAEIGLLGAVFRDASVLWDAHVRPEDFYVPAHRDLWAAFLDLDKEGNGVDLVTVVDQFSRSGKKVDAVWLARVAESMPSVGRAGEYATMVREAARRREMITRSMELGSLARDLTRPLDDAIRLAQETADAGADPGVCETGQRPDQVCDHFLSYVDRVQEQGGGGIATQFDRLNWLIGGLFPGEIVILAARPGCGKTAMALNLGMYAIVSGCGVGVISLEMPSDALMARLGAASCDVDAQHFRTGKFWTGEVDKLRAFAGKMRSQRFRIYDRPGITPTGIRAQARRWHREMGLDLLIIDYLQLIRPDSRAGSREQEVAEASRTIKELALELNVPVLLLAQLNRDAEKTKKPMLSQLRESGAVEQDADIVLFLSGMRATEDRDVIDVDLDVAKGRSNACGTVQLNFVRRFLRFETPPIDDDNSMTNGGYGE
jgi:replicative DNA helicase